MPYLMSVHLKRHRFLPDAGSGTVFCTMTFDGTGPALDFLRPGQFPEFEGDAAWFRVMWRSKKRREFLEQIEAPR